MTTAIFPGGIGGKGLLAVAGLLLGAGLIVKSWELVQLHASSGAQSAVVQAAAPSSAPRLSPPWERLPPAYPMRAELAWRTPFSSDGPYKNIGHPPAVNLAVAPAWAVDYPAPRPTRRHKR